MNRFLLILILAVTGVARGAELEALQKNYAEARARIEADHKRHSTAAQEICVAALKAVEAKLEQANEDRALRDVREEREALVEFSIAPKAAHPLSDTIFRTWSNNMMNADADRAKKRVALAQRYRATLKQHIAHLTRQNQLNDARAFQREMDTLKKDASLAAAEELMRNPAGGHLVRGNVALSTRGTVVTGITNTEKIIDGDTARYRRGENQGFAHSKRNPCTITVTFPKIYRLQRLRMLLFDLDKRYYRFRIESSPDGERWESLANHAEKNSSSWQDLAFSPRPVKMLRITGLYSSVSGRKGHGFHVVELEAFCYP